MGVSRLRHERQKDELRRTKADNEVRRLRAEVDAARAERAWYAEALRSPRNATRSLDIRSSRRGKRNMSLDLPEDTEESPLPIEDSYQLEESFQDDELSRTLGCMKFETGQ